LKPANDKLEASCAHKGEKVKIANNILLLILFCCLLSSCAGPVHSVYSLSSPEEAEYDERLKGTWILVEVEEEKEVVWDEVIFFVGRREKDNRTQIGFAGYYPESGGMDVFGLEMFTTTLDSGNYMNISNPGGVEDDNILELEDHYAIYKYEFLRPDILLTRMLNEDLIKEAIKDKRLKGERSSEHTTLLTDTSENIAGFIESDKTGKLFVPFLLLVRMVPKVDESDESLIDAIEDILKEVDRRGATPDTDKAMPAKGADVNAKDCKGTSLINTSLEGRTETVKALLAKGADVNAQSNNGITALIAASDRGHAEVVKVLLAAGADVNAKCNIGGVALMNASYQGHPAVVKVLLAAGADVDAKANDGTTALMDASKKGQIGAVKALLAGGADINAKANDGTTALMFAEKNGHSEVIRILKEAGAKE
jgi:ankyrin repeat protein